MTNCKLRISPLTVRELDGEADSVITNVGGPDGQQLQVTVTQGLDRDSSPSDTGSLGKRVLIEIDGTLPVTIYLNDGRIIDWPGEPA